MKKGQSLIAAFIIVFAVFNLIVLIACGVSGHSGTFWFAYLFTDLFLIAIPLILAYEVSRNKEISKLIFYGYSVTRWSGIFAFIEMLIAIVFMVLDDHFKIALILMLVLCAAYIVIVLMCKTTEEIIKDVRTGRSAGTASMKGLTASVKAAAASADSSEVKKALEKLADKFSFSDMVSNEATAEIETRLGSKIEEIRQTRDASGQLALIRECELLLAERNILCREGKKQ